MGGGELRQASVWSLLGIDKRRAPGLQEVEAFLDLLGECDTEMRKALVLDRGHGTDDYPVLAMWRLVALKLFLRKGRFSDLLGELRRNADLADLLGFRERLPGDFQLPSKHAVSRFHRKLKTRRFKALLKRVQEKTVGLARIEDPRIGENTATDSTDIRTHGHAARHENDPERKKPATDLEASWSVKTKRWEDADGKEREETKSTFGYKACLNVDVSQPIIIEAKTVTGSHNDQLLSTPVLEGAVRILGPGVMRTCAQDKGFDSTENVLEGYRDLNVAVIVPPRDVPKDLKEKPAEDREMGLVPGGNVVRDIYTGEVACYEKHNEKESTRRELHYAGFDKKRESHKFRCPLGANAANTCTAYETCSAGSCGKHGRQVRVPMAIDVRRFAPIYPRSKKWKRLYNGRSATERANGYLKSVLRLEDHCLRGHAAIEVRVLLGAITLNLRTILALRAARSRVQEPAAEAAAAA